METLLRQLGPKTVGWLERWFNRREYESYHATAKSVAVSSALAFAGKNEPTEPAEHGSHKARLAQYAVQIEKLPRDRPLILNFGDSLTDLTRLWLTVFDFVGAVSGSWSEHIAQMVRETRALIGTRPVFAIVVGTLGGNPLLFGEPIGPVIERARAALNEIRALYPHARILVYGLPPVYSLHATVHSWEFDRAMLEWVVQDRDAVFISLKRFGRGFLWLNPSFLWSSDGVHFTKAAALRFCQLVRQALMSPYKLVA